MTATIYTGSLGKEPFFDASMKLRAEGWVGRQNVKTVARLAEGKYDMEIVETGAYTSTSSAIL